MLAGAIFMDTGGGAGGEGGGGGDIVANVPWIMEFKA